MISYIDNPRFLFRNFQFEPFFQPQSDCTSVHISLGVRYSPVSLIVPVTQYGVSYFRFLLHRTDPQLSVHTFLYGKHLDPYIRGFRQSVVDILTIDIL